MSTKNFIVNSNSLLFKEKCLRVTIAFFAIRAKDMQSDFLIAKDLPRVKRDAKDCILAVAEVDSEEYSFIKAVNDIDTNNVDKTIEKLEL